MTLHECPDCGQTMIIKTPSGRCEPCLKQHYRQLATEWDHTHPDFVRKQDAARSRR